MAYGGFRNLNKRTAADKTLCDKEFNIAKNPKYDGYHVRFNVLFGVGRNGGLDSMVCKCFNEKKTRWGN